MKRQANRSVAGNIAVFLVLLLFGIFFLLPIVYAVVTAFKPMNEIFVFPPRMYVLKPTWNNFVSLSYIMEDFWVPLSRYLFNSIFITLAATAGHILLASMAAYPMAKHSFYGQKTLSRIIVISLLFTTSVMYVPQYVVLAASHMINTYWAAILPALQGSLGLYLMMNFMNKIPDEMLEAARIDGARELRVFWSVVMPNVKPAWLTLLIFSFQSLWNYSDGLHFLGRRGAHRRDGRRRGDADDSAHRAVRGFSEPGNRNDEYLGPEMSKAEIPMEKGRGERLYG